MNKMQTTKVSDLNLPDKLDKEGPEYRKWTIMLEMFKDETLTAALEIIEGMPGVIDSFIREENTNRKLSDVKATFL